MEDTYGKLRIIQIFYHYYHFLNSQTYQFIYPYCLLCIAQFPMRAQRLDNSQLTLVSPTSSTRQMINKINTFRNQQRKYSKEKLSTPRNSLSVKTNYRHNPLTRNQQISRLQQQVNQLLSHQYESQPVFKLSQLTTICNNKLRKMGINTDQLADKSYISDIIDTFCHKLLDSKGDSHQHLDKYQQQLKCLKAQLKTLEKECEQAVLIGEVQLYQKLSGYFLENIFESTLKNLQINQQTKGIKDQFNQKLEKLKKHLQSLNSEQLNKNRSILYQSRDYKNTYNIIVSTFQQLCFDTIDLIDPHPIIKITSHKFPIPKTSKNCNTTSYRKTPKQPPQKIQKRNPTQFSCIKKSFNDTFFNT